MLRSVASQLVSVTKHEHRMVWVALEKRLLTGLKKSSHFQLRLISSTAGLFRDEERNDSSIERTTALSNASRRHDNDWARNPAVVNQRIIDLGKKQDWHGILSLYEEKGDKFNDVNFSSVMNQLGRIPQFQRSNPVFLRFLEDLATELETEGLGWSGERGVSNIIHAIGKMKLECNNAMRILRWMSLPETVKNFIKISGPQALSTVAWAHGTLGYEAPNLFSEIDRESKRLVREGFPQHVANVAWACGKLGYEAPTLFSEIDRESKWLVREGNARNVANVAWSCAKLGYDAPNLFSEIDRESKRLVREGNPQNVVSVAWSCAKLGYDAQNLLTEVEARSDELLVQFNDQHVANLCFAIVVSGSSIGCQELLTRLWDIIIQKSSSVDFPDTQLRQLAQIQVLARADDVKLSQPPEILRTKMDQAILHLGTSPVTDKARELFLLLTDHGISFELGASPSSDASLSRPISVDLACVEQRIAIEFNGPFDFLKEVGSGKLSYTRNGRKKSKRRFLEKLGWSVIEIDFRAWDEAVRASNQLPWLRSQLESVGLSLHLPTILKN